MSVKRRVKNLENASRAKENKFIVITFRTEDEMTRLIQERKDELRQKYGPNISEQCRFICIRKFGGANHEYERSNQKD